MSREQRRGNPPEVVALAQPDIPKKEFEISVGQTFPLFPQGFTKRIGYERIPYPTYKSSLLLAVPTGEKFAVGTAARNITDAHAPFITPFHPDQGYQIGQDDFDESTGSQKVNDWMKNFSLLQTDPLYIGIVLAAPQKKGPLDSLQLEMSVNGQTLLSNAYRTKESAYNEENTLDFDTFYPPDKGPLPNMYHGGVIITVPDDLELLRSLQGKFILP